MSGTNISHNIPECPVHNTTNTNSRWITAYYKTDGVEENTGMNDYYCYACEIALSRGELEAKIIKTTETYLREFVKESSKLLRIETIIPVTIYPKDKKE